jgi:glycosyltransferase involved in cell wall biosynthesis
MDILYITQARIPTEKAHGVNITSMCKFFNKGKNNIKLIIPRVKNKIKEDTFQYYDIKDHFEIVRLPAISIFKLEKILGKLTFFTQLLSFYISVLFYLLLQKRSDKVLYTRDYLPSFISLLGYKVVYECHSIPRKRKMFFLITKLFSKVIVISKGLKEDFLEQGFKDNKILIAADAVNLNIFIKSITREEARKKLNLPENKDIICYCGKFKTMGMDKGIKDILLSLTFLEKEVLFLAVGGDQKDINFYQKMADDLKVSKLVKFIGHIKQNELAVYQKAADILLMPFPNIEHYSKFMSPIKMFEYMASKRPIIASNLPTIKEVLNNDNCLFCEPDNPRDLAIKIEELLNNKERGDKLSQVAFKDVQRYTWENRVKMILKFI